MAEFDDKLNSLLSNPEAMDQIMKMAQSLMGNSGGAEQPPPPRRPLAKQEAQRRTAAFRFSRAAPPVEGRHRTGGSLSRKTETHLPAGLWRAVSRGLAQVFSPDWVIWIPRPSPPSCRSSGSWERPRTATPVSFCSHCGPI